MSLKQRKMKFVPRIQLNHNKYTLLLPSSATRRGIKEDGKPCVTRVTTVLFEEKKLLQTSSSFKQIFFCKRPENINVKWRSRWNTQIITRSRLSRTSVLPSSSSYRPVEYGKTASLSPSLWRIILCIHLFFYFYFEAWLMVLHCVMFCAQRRLKIKPKTLVYNAVLALPGTFFILSDALFFSRKIYQSKWNARNW